MEIIPSLAVKNSGEKATNMMLRLTQAKNRVVVRFTGGCGYMSTDDGRGLYNLFTKAFQGFQGAILFGGTRIILRSTLDVKTSITEIPPIIKKNNPECIILGVVPKTNDIKITELGLVVSEHPDYITIVHPHQDMALVVQNNVNDTSPWDAEYLECLQIIDDLRSFASWDSVLIVYNGGLVTEKELIITAKRGWPVIIISGSGRIADQYSSNDLFLREFTNVLVAPNSVIGLRRCLITLGIVPNTTHLECVTSWRST